MPIIKEFTKSMDRNQKAPVAQLDDLTHKKRLPFFWITGSYNDMERGDTFFFDWSWHDYPESHHTT